MLEKRKESFEKSLKLPIISLGLSGIHILPKNNERSFLQLLKSWMFYINFSIFYPAYIGECYWVIDGFRRGLTFNELATPITLCTVCTLGIVKSHTLYYNRRLLIGIVDKLRSMHPEDNIEDVAKNSYKDFEKKVEKQALKFLNMVVTFLYYSCAAVMLMFSTSPLIYMLYEFLSTGKTNRKLPYFVWYFFDPTTSLRWPFIYIQQDWASFITCFNIFGADTLLYALVAYLQMHFRLLCYQYETVVSDKTVEAKQRFRKVVQKHQKLILLVEQTELLYTKSTLFNIMSSSLLICLSGFIIAFINDVGTVLSFVTFLIMSLSQIFLLCYFGDMLMTSSTQVFEAVYNCKWYEADQDIKRCVLLVMIRSLRPCKLTAMNFADLNLSAFTTILSRSWSYFALLKTIMDD